jgi:hypothetical protein
MTEYDIFPLSQAYIYSGPQNVTSFLMSLVWFQPLFLSSNSVPLRVEARPHKTGYVAKHI